MALSFKSNCAAASGVSFWRRAKVALAFGSFARRASRSCWSSKFLFFSESRRTTMLSSWVFCSTTEQSNDMPDETKVKPEPVDLIENVQCQRVCLTERHSRKGAMGRTRIERCESGTRLTTQSIGSEAFNCHRTRFRTVYLTSSPREASWEEGGPTRGLARRLSSVI